MKHLPHGTQVHVEARDFMRYYSIHIRYRDPSDETKDRFITGLIGESVEEGQRVPEPAINIDQNTAQQLMDSLWHAGIRPTEGSGSAGSMKATENHLNDMRALVFKAAGTEKP